MESIASMYQVAARKKIRFPSRAHSGYQAAPSVTGSADPPSADTRHKVGLSEPVRAETKTSHIPSGDH